MLNGHLMVKLLAVTTEWDLQIVDAETLEILHQLSRAMSLFGF